MRISPKDETKRRFFDDPGGRDVMCNTCKHRIPVTVTCKAYPGGIPRKLILRGEHDTPYEGDGGYRYEPQNRNQDRS